MKRLLSILFVLFFLVSLHAMSITGEFSSKEVILGKEVQFKLRIKHTNKETIQNAPEFRGSPEVFIRNIKRNTLKDKNGLIDEFLYKLQFFSTGNTTIFPITAVSGTKEVTLPTMEISVSGVIPKGDTSEIKDIKKPFDISMNPQKMIRFAEYVIALILIILIIYYIYKRFSLSGDKKENNTFSKPLLSPYSEALVSIKDCRRLISSGQLEDAYFLMSALVRRYFGRHFSLQLLESTTNEVLSLLKDVLDKKYYEELKELLIKFDPIKYTPQGVDKESAEKDLESLSILLKRFNDDISLPLSGDDK